MKSETGFGFAVGASVLAILIAAGVVTTPWAFAFGAWIGWLLLEAFLGTRS